EGRLTLDELLEHLRGIGVEGVSRSALGRQKQKIDKMAARLRQSREMAEALVREVGPSAAEGEQGRLLVQALRGLVMDHLANLEEDADPKSFMAIARALKDMAQANRLDQDFEARVRERIQREAEKKLDDATARAAAESAGLTPEQALERVRAIYRGEA
ncbi:phage protein Gp27 family protein, partial [uncultured Desulfovibrio sp.]|uniref:phage protein Gp27 family protein n=1 Tax=uncultured Desulfovibrio sp. TaxID=167968 RepID=UPI00266FF78F